MKYLKFIDFAMQSLLMAGGLVAVGLTLFSPGWFILILYLQMVLGPWQITSALIRLLTRHPQRQAIVYYVLATTVYLLIGWRWSLFMDDFTVHRIVLMAYLTVIPWGLALYYYRLLSIDYIRGYRPAGKFLRHLQF